MISKNLNQLFVNLADFVSADVRPELLDFQTQLRVVLENPVNAPLLLPALENNTLNLTPTGEYIPTPKGLRLGNPVKPVAVLKPRRVGKHTSNEVLFDAAYPVVRELAYRMRYPDFKEQLEATEMYPYIVALNTTSETSIENKIDNFIQLGEEICFACSNDVAIHDILNEKSSDIYEVVECLVGNVVKATGEVEVAQQPTKTIKAGVDGAPFGVVLA